MFREEPNLRWNLLEIRNGGPLPKSDEESFGLREFGFHNLWSFIFMGGIDFADTC